MTPTRTITETNTVLVTKLPLDGKTIKIGDIAANLNGFQTEQSLIQLLIPDLNEYTKLLGYNVKFEFLIDEANGQSTIHLERVKAFRQMSVNLIIGGRWTAQASASLQYINQNKMLLFSPSSTSPILSIPNDYLFRMCSDDTVQAPVISSMLRDWGIKAVIVIMRNDTWASDIYNIFEKDFTKRGGIVVDKICYKGETIDFSGYLQNAENKAREAIIEYGAEHVGIEVLCFEESAFLFQQAENFPTIYGLRWFGSDGTALSESPINISPKQASHLVVFSTKVAPAPGEKYNNLSTRYELKTGRPFDYFSACVYDIATIMMQAVLTTQDDATINADKIIPLIEPLAYSQWGASGWNKLNTNGDRAASNYDIYGFVLNDGVGDHQKFGFYNHETETIIWDTNGLNSIGLKVIGGS